MSRTIIDVANEYVTQDNRGTAFPYALLVTEEELVRTDDGEIIGIWSPRSADMTYYDDVKDARLLQEVLDNNDEEDPAEITEEFEDIWGTYDMLEFYKKYIDKDADLYQFNKERRSKGEQMFLTESSAEAHIRMNGHNMKNPITYGIHVFRNPDMEIIILDLMSKATLPIEQWGAEARHWYLRSKL